MTDKLQSSQKDFPSNFACSNEPIMIQGPCGNLEVQVSCPEETRQENIVIVSHPHPLYGGTMQNKVVHYLAKTMNQLGLKAVRYNFRGVGDSDGDYAEGIGETEDLIAVVKWVRGKSPDCAIWLAGFSFGGYVSIRAAARIGAERLITIAPAIRYIENENIEYPTCRWLLVQGLQDEVVSADSILEWSKALDQPPEIVTIKEAGHFFHGQLNVLRDVLMQHLGEDVE